MNLPIRALSTVTLLASLLATNVDGQNTTPPPGFTIPETTLSPNKRLGVLVPDLERYEAGGKNKLVEVETGRVLEEIKAEAGLVYMNHGGIAPLWSTDSSLLLWKVEGKWFPRALVLLKLKDGAVQWQEDLLKAGQREILARTRQVAPKKYAAAKKQNAGKGDAYPDGFTVDVVAGEGEAPTSPSRVASSCAFLG